ncbi:hypothetical protein LINPERPRIM_LOCUS37561 [Linum perenne]
MAYDQAMVECLIELIGNRGIGGFLFGGGGKAERDIYRGSVAVEGAGKRDGSRHC